MIYKIEVPNIQIENKLILNQTLLTVEGRKSYCIKGSNGSGKTTLLNYIVMGKDLTVYKNGEKLDLKQFRKQIAFVPNTPPIFKMLTGYENIQYIAALWDIKNRKDFREKVEYYSEKFHLKKNNLKDPVYTYSLGMKYKLYFIAMISREINLLLLDEPFTALDKLSQEKVYTTLKGFLNKDKILIFVTHIEEFKNRLSDNIYKIDNKKLTLL